MKKLFNRGALVSGALMLAGSFLAGSAMAQDCSSEVQYRLWRSGQSEVWARPGETLEVISGEEAHIYIHTKAKGNTPYTTSAEIGYPANFGGNENSQAVRSHVRMMAQNDDDRRSGRIRFVAEQPGNARLGYRIIGVKPPGDLAQVPRRCQVGMVSITVSPSRSSRPGPGGSGGYGGAGYGGSGGHEGRPGAGRQGAATDLVTTLYRAILRRDRVESDPDSFVRDVEQSGKDGLERVAETMTVSDEFRNQALARTEQAHGRARSLDDLRTQLLDDIYRDLYGYAAPERRDRESDLADLDSCLSGNRSSGQACASLGRNLISSRLFYDKHQALIEDLPSPGRGRRR